MVATFEGLKGVIANALQNVLILGGSAFEINVSARETVSFCRMDGSALESDRISCGNLNSSVTDLPHFREYLDLLVQVGFQSNSTLFASLFRQVISLPEPILSSTMLVNIHERI